MPTITDAASGIEEPPDTWQGHGAAGEARPDPRETIRARVPKGRRTVPESPARGLRHPQSAGR